MEIVSDPAVQGGVPVFAGTRIPVEVIAGLKTKGFSVEEIEAEFPALTAEDIQHA